MRLERVISYLTGYVIVLARGAHLEKLLNLLANSGLYLWDVKRLGSEVIQVKIRAHGFLRIREAVRRTRSTVRIHQKKGWPFIRQRMGRRKMFWIGAVIFVSLLIYLSTFVFFIKVEGFDGEERRLLLANLARLGLKPGVLRREVLPKKEFIEREVMIHTPGAVWLGITARGVVVEVKVVKRKIAPASPKICDIVAAKDGVISKIAVIRGIPVVNEGDIVARGDLLISGVEWLHDPEANELIKRTVPAGGIVEATVWYNLEAVEPKIVWRPQVKKAIFSEYKLRWGRKLWRLGSFGNKPKGACDWIRWHRLIYQGRNPVDSVELIKDTWRTVTWLPVVRSRREIQRAAAAEIEMKIKVLGITPTNMVKNWTEEGNFLKLTVICEQKEDIAALSFN